MKDWTSPPANWTERTFERTPHPSSPLVAQRKLTQKARNTRFQAVTTAFRRVKKRHPDAAWPQGFFGEDGTLAILEQKDTVAEAQKTLILAHKFHALVDVADTQWKSIL